MISSEDMASFFDPSADKIVELISNQLEQLEDTHDPLRTRFKARMTLRTLSLRLIFFIECIPSWRFCRIPVFARID